MYSNLLLQASNLDDIPLFSPLPMWAERQRAWVTASEVAASGVTASEVTVSEVTASRVTASGLGRKS